MATVNLSEEEAEYLQDILDVWVDGYGDAFQQTIVDPTFDQPEELLEAVAGLHEQVELAVLIRGKLSV